ncbi:hypothetical protein FOA52_004701 [Chlamydomonas sp. UWO 241]|nr:hypothetical protein FOA52_004701 [Chlamydomonas sp. UWO 241]
MRLGSTSCGMSCVLTLVAVVVLGCCSADAYTIRLSGPTIVTVNVTSFDQGLYPPGADMYFEAVNALMGAELRQNYLFPRLPLKASMKFSNVNGEVIVAVYMMDTSGALNEQIIDNVNADDVARFVSAAKLQGSRARIYVGRRSHSFYCLTAGPDAVPSLC